VCFAPREQRLPGSSGEAFAIEWLHQWGVVANMSAVLEQAADELIERFGSGAVAWMKERIGKLEADQDWRAVDEAWQLLTLVEQRLDAAQ
jgi:hypothetical protein